MPRKKASKVKFPFKLIKCPQKILSTSSGAHGEYMQLSSTVGFKVLFTIEGYGELSKPTLLRRIGREIEEFNTLKTAYQKCNKFVPKPLNFTVMEEMIPDNYVYSWGDTYIYHVGYTMTHVKGKLLSNLRYNKKKKKSIVTKLYAKLAERGVYHKDLHSENVIINGNKAVAIDFDPDYVEFEYCPAKYGG